MAIYFLPIISAFIGWFTNWVAIKMLFHPKEPKRILFITFQGIFPKRQKQFAQKLGTTVANELLHFDEIASRINEPQSLSAVTPYIEEHVNTFLHEKLKEKLPVISMFVSDGMLQKLKEGLMEEINMMLPQLIQKFTDNLSNQIDVEKIVTEKVENFSSDKLEAILVGIMNKEFRFVEIIGGVLGFLIGVLQIIMTKI